MMDLSDEMKKLLSVKINKLQNNASSKNYELLNFNSKSEAFKKAISMIPNDSVIGFGGSKTVESLGLIEHLNSKKYPNFLNRSAQNISVEEKRDIERKMFLSDIFITGTNAITEDGILINTDKWGNRVAAMIFGPKKVFVFVGVNKIVSNVEEGIDRIKKLAAPLNNIRFGLKNPCVNTGYCVDCNFDTKICYSTTMINGSPVKGRITIFLINQYLGF
jgi:hypothetical protein